MDEREIERIHVTSFASDVLEAAENCMRIAGCPGCAEDGPCIPARSNARGLR
jgi:hypothetical protein